MTAFNEGHEIMDDMEKRLELIDLGDAAYCVLVGAQSSGANTDDGMLVVTAWFLSKLISDRPPVNPTDEDDDGDDAETS